MKTIFKIFISAIAGFVVAWVCYQVFHLEQVMTTAVAAAMASAAYGLCEKVYHKK